MSTTTNTNIQLVERQRELELLSSADACPTRLHRPRLQCVLHRAAAAASVAAGRDGANVPESATGDKPPVMAPGTPEATTTAGAVLVTCSGGAHDAARLAADEVARVAAAAGDEAAAPLPDGVCELLRQGFDAAVLVCRDASAVPAAGGGAPFRVVGDLLAEAVARLQGPAVVDGADSSSGGGGDGGDRGPELVASAWALRADDALVDALAAAQLTSREAGAADGCKVAAQARPPVTRVRLGDDGPRDLRRLLEAAEAGCNGGDHEPVAPPPFGALGGSPARQGEPGHHSCRLRAVFGRLDAQWHGSSGGSGSGSSGRRASLLVVDLTPTMAFEAAEESRGSGGISSISSNSAQMRARGAAQLGISALSGLVGALAHHQRNETGSLLAVSLRGSALLRCVGPLVAGPVCCFWSLHLAEGRPPAPAIAPGSAPGIAAAATASSAELVRLVAKARRIVTAVVSSSFEPDLSKPLLADQQQQQQQQQQQHLKEAVPFDEYWAARARLMAAAAVPRPASPARSSPARCCPAVAEHHAEPQAAAPAANACSGDSGGSSGANNAIGDGGSGCARPKASPERPRRRAPGKAAEAAVVEGEEGAAPRTYAALSLRPHSGARQAHPASPCVRPVSAGRAARASGAVGGYSEAFAAARLAAQDRQQDQDQEEQQGTTPYGASSCDEIEGDGGDGDSQGADGLAALEARLRELRAAFARGLAVEARLPPPVPPRQPLQQQPLQRQSPPPPQQTVEHWPALSTVEEHGGHLRLTALSVPKQPSSPPPPPPPQQQQQWAKEQCCLRPALAMPACAAGGSYAALAAVRRAAGPAAGSCGGGGGGSSSSGGGSQGGSSAAGGDDDEPTRCGGSPAGQSSLRPRSGERPADAWCRLPPLQPLFGCGGGIGLEPMTVAAMRQRLAEERRRGDALASVAAREGARAAAACAEARELRLGATASAAAAETAAMRARGTLADETRAAAAAAPAPASEGTQTNGPQPPSDEALVLGAANPTTAAAGPAPAAAMGAAPPAAAAAAAGPAPSSPRGANARLAYVAALAVPALGGVGCSAAGAAAAADVAFLCGGQWSPRQRIAAPQTMGEAPTVVVGADDVEAIL